MKKSLFLDIFFCLNLYFLTMVGRENKSEKCGLGQRRLKPIHLPAFKNNIRGIKDMKLLHVFAITIFILSILSYANATEELAEKTGKSCKFCHLDPSGGGELTKAGKNFLLKKSPNSKDEQKKNVQSGGLERNKRGF